MHTHTHTRMHAHDARTRCTGRQAHPPARPPAPPPSTHKRVNTRKHVHTRTHVRTDAHTRTHMRQIKLDYPYLTSLYHKILESDVFLKEKRQNRHTDRRRTDRRRTDMISQLPVSVEYPWRCQLSWNWNLLFATLYHVQSPPKISIYPNILPNVICVDFHFLFIASSALS